MAGAARRLAARPRASCARRPGPRFLGNPPGPRCAAGFPYGYGFSPVPVVPSLLLRRRFKGLSSNCHFPHISLNYDLGKNYLFKNVKIKINALQGHGVGVKVGTCHFFRTSAERHGSRSRGFALAGYRLRFAFVVLSHLARFQVGSVSSGYSGHPRGDLKMTSLCLSLSCALWGKIWLYFCCFVKKKKKKESNTSFRSTWSILKQ